MHVRLALVSFCILLVAQDVMSLTCHKCESVTGFENQACIKGDDIKGDKPEAFPNKDGIPLCYKFKGMTTDTKKETYKRDIRAKLTKKLIGKCFDSKDLAPGEFPKYLEGTFCFCDKDLCNDGPVALGGGSGAAAVQIALYWMLVVVTSFHICMIS